ncbi:MAG: thioredoxin family protein [Chloroflexi bacterium]|nr:thioredoxin family protein [Chloroflexota bacterium]
MTIPRLTKLVFVCLAIAALAACSGGPASSPMPTVPARAALTPLLATSDIAVGKNRLVFALLDKNSAPVKASAVDMRLSVLQGDAAVPQGTAQAAYRPWPSGPGGVFVAEVDTPQAGLWVADLAPTDGVAAGQQAQLTFQVAPQSATPALGAPAPATVNRTAKDVASLAELSSDLSPDPDLYSMTIADAARSGKPTVVTFATPAFCESATCGPQVDVVKQVKKAHQGAANFIHVEIYANPQEMRTDPSKGKVAPAVQEWRLPSEPWTFVLDAKGNVAAKFEGFVSYEELEPALTKALG